MPAPCLFDMDGLLLDTERVFMALSVELLTPKGFSVETVEAFFRTLVGSSSAETRARIAEFLGSAEAADAFYLDWYDALEATLSTHIPLRPHVREVLMHLQRAGHPMSVVTSTRGKLARAHLETAGLLHFFEHVTGGDEVSANKPDPAPYLEGAAKFGVAATACFAFEDSDRGIASAVAAGCRSAQIPDIRDASVPLPVLGQVVATDLRDAVLQLGLADPQSLSVAAAV